MSDVDEIMESLIEQGRICPLPQAWQRLWEMLPDRRRKGLGWQPALPLILAAWHHTTNAEKRDRLRLHLQWAHEHQTLGEVAAFIAGLKPEDWHTGN